MIDSKIYKEIQDSFSAYLTGKNEKEKERRKTEVRFTILKEICEFRGHFDVDMLQNKLDEAKYRVSKATLYNTINTLIDAGIIVKHQFGSGIIVHHPHQKIIPIQYELRKKAEAHLHFVCTHCHGVREIKHPLLLNSQLSAGARYTAQYVSVCMYGLCGRCKNKMQRDAQKNNNQNNNKSNK
jgi:Fur family ferric uptake transcriptional regulator